MTTWDILIASITYRTEQLIALLKELERQSVPGVGVLVYRDNRHATYGDKCQRLYEASKADYVSMVDDDDWVAEDYVASVMKALRQKPDYVGYRVLWTEHGAPQIPIVHSLEYDGWGGTSEFLYRDITHKNPLRRELALRARFEGDAAADVRWADDLRGQGVVKDEVFIDRDLYHYLAHGPYEAGGYPPMPDPPPRPEFDFVTWVE